MAIHPSIRTTRTEDRAIGKKIAVVIPFYQHQPGLLRRAVGSALGQCGEFTVTLIIVDDGSPISARSELADLLPAHQDRIILIEQPNAGCYPASNAALANVPPGTDFVAFLDSDDDWAPDHLEHAVWALDQGFDLYFSDFYQLRQNVTAFSRARRIDVSQHPRIHPEAPIHEYRGDMVDQILRGNILGTSTIVYSYPRLGHLRYLEGFQHTGPEYLLWLKLALASRRIAFSSAPECQYGDGVNIFSESAWGTDKYLSVRHDEIKWRKHVLATLSLSSDQRRHIRRANSESRRNFALGLIHNLVHSGRVSRGILTRQLRLDPATFAILPLVPALAAGRRVGAAWHSRLARTTPLP